MQKRLRNAGWAGLAVLAGLVGCGWLHTGAASAAGAPASGLSVNVALGSRVTATSSAPGARVASAVDGSASTQWCAGRSTASVIVDLRARRTLQGVGATVQQTALVSVSAADSPGQWRPVRGLGRSSVPAGQPVYWPRALSARWVKATVTTSNGAPACIDELRLFAAVSRAVVPDRGADLSFEPQEEAAGAHYTDGGASGTPLSILNHHGLNFVRLRLWVNPPPGDSSLVSDLRMARRIKAAGDRLYLDLHYSDTWADPGHQAIPRAWRGQNLAQLTTTVRRYTAGVIRRFAAQGTTPDMVSIGNEIRNGMLWPLGQVNWNVSASWKNLTRLLSAGVAGARAANPRGHRMQIVLHFDLGGSRTLSRTFYRHMVAGHVPFDVIGLSYYPFFHGSLSALRATVDDLASRFRKPIVLAEFGYPWTLANGDGTRNFVWNSSQVSRGYPATPGGQLSFANDALSILAQVPHHRGLGLFYWEPDWIPGVGWTAGAGSFGDNLTLFSFTGQALPAIRLFGNPLATCVHYDPGALPCAVPGGA